MGKVEQPTIERESFGGGFEEVIKHPAFAQIGASRVSGGVILYGSDFQHQNFVRIRINKSQLHRKLSNDWPYGGSQGYIEVDLSEAQWAEFVSSMNVGNGVQCTLRYLQGEQIPELPKPEPRMNQFNGELKETIEDSLAHMDKLIASIEATKVSQKQKDEMLGHLRMARQELLANIPFVLKQFGEHMETTVQKAKIEINAYATHTVMRAGLDALEVTNATPIVAIGLMGKESA